MSRSITTYTDQVAKGNGAALHIHSVQVGVVGPRPAEYDDRILDVVIRFAADEHLRTDPGYGVDPSGFCAWPS